MVKTRSSSIGLKAETERCTTIKEGNFSTTFSLQSFVKRVEKLSEAQRIAIEKTGFGNLLRIPRHRLSKNLLAELMDRWCPDKRAFLLFPRNSTSNSVLAISLMDVALVLGLRVVGNPVILQEDKCFIDLEREYGAAIWNRKISIASIEQRLDSIGDAVNEDFVRSFLLFIFGTVLFPTYNSKVDSRFLSVLKNLDNVSSFAWGAAVLDCMINWLSDRKETNKQFVGGCLIFLQMWSYEHIDIARPSLLGCGISFPRACRWENSRPRQRQWFRMRFKELDKIQVMCKLQLTHDELKINIVKELIKAQVDGEVLLAEGSSVAIKKVGDFRARLKVMDQWIAEQAPQSKLTVVRQVHGTAGECSNQLRGQIEPPSTSVILTDYVDLTTTPHQVSEGQIGQIELPSTSVVLTDYVDPTTPHLVSEGQIGQIELPSTSVILKDYVDLTTPHQVSVGQSVQMEPQLSSSVVLTDMDLATPLQVSKGQRGEIELLLSSSLVLTTPYQVSKGQREQIDRPSSTSQNSSPSVVVISDDDTEEENIGRKEQISLEENTQLKEINNLREENKILKDRLEEQSAELRNLRDGYKILKDQLQDRNAELDNLRRENQLLLSSSDDLVAQIERIVHKWI